MNNIIQKPSPNFGSRDGNPIKYICLHIAAGTLLGTDNWFANPKSQVSSNYGVGYNGEIHQYVNDSNMAWANGVVKSPTAQIVKDNLGVNQNKISLSIENEGYSLDKAPDTQINALVGLIRLLATKYNIPMDRQHIIGHYEIDLIDRPNCPSVDKTIIDKIINKLKNMQKLEITKIEVVGEKTNVSWHRFNDDNQDNNSSGVWEFDGALNNDEVLAKAKTMVDSDIEVLLNLTI